MFAGDMPSVYNINNNDPFSLLSPVRAQPITSHEASANGEKQFPGSPNECFIGPCTTTTTMPGQTQQMGEQSQQQCPPLLCGSVQAGSKGPLSALATQHINNNYQTKIQLDNKYNNNYKKDKCQYLLLLPNNLMRCLVVAVSMVNKAHS
jgi:hypothetical protein